MTSLETVGTIAGSAGGISAAVWFIAKTVARMFLDQIARHDRELREMERWTAVAQEKFARFESDLDAAHEKIRRLETRGGPIL
jgi:hypothetical protein